MARGKVIPTEGMPREMFLHSGPCEGSTGGVYCVWCNSDSHCGCRHAKNS